MEDQQERCLEGAYGLVMNPSHSAVTVSVPHSSLHHRGPTKASQGANLPWEIPGACRLSSAPDENVLEASVSAKGIWRFWTMGSPSCSPPPPLNPYLSTHLHGCVSLMDANSHTVWPLPTHFPNGWLYALFQLLAGPLFQAWQPTHRMSFFPVRGPLSPDFSRICDLPYHKLTPPEKIC